MRKYFLMTCTLLIAASAVAANINGNKQKSDEIKASMWTNAEKDFTVTAIPAKWNDEQAVIIAKSINLSYRKGALSQSLFYDRYIHYRIKLLSATAIDEYAQFKINGGTNSEGLQLEIYAGVKVIKANGKEIEVPMSSVVRETEKANDYSRDVYKLAVPNLEIGDIIDYYQVYQYEIYMGGMKYYTFDPVFLTLQGDYPIIKQKVSFDVLRRCYINLKTLNGAPEFKAVEKEDGKTQYSLESGDNESVLDLPWFYPYRQVPAIKFKVIYASSMMANMMPGFIGEPGVIKSKVTKDELKHYINYLLQNFGTPLNPYMKERFKGTKDPQVLAEGAYYGLRNILNVSKAELRTLSGNDPNPDNGVTRAMLSLSDYYHSKNIPHDLLIGIPREISSINDMIFEEELTLMIKVNTKKPFYVGRMDNNSIIGEIASDLQGENVYSLKRSVLTSDFEIVTVPVVVSSQNKTNVSYKINFTDLAEGSADLEAIRTMTGINRVAHQNYVMDYYDYKDEEGKLVKTPVDEVMSKKNLARLAKLKEDYQATRGDKIQKSIKEMADGEFDFSIEEAGSLQINQTGRFDDKPEFIYGFKAKIKGVTKRAGPNYLFDIGKLIEKQISLSKDDKVRNYDAYVPNAQTFEWRIETTIPEGYTAKGLDQLNTRVDNEAGSFISSAKIEGGVLVLSVSKIYKTNFVKKADWSKVIAFTQAAEDFTKKQIVLEKKP